MNSLRIATQSGRKNFRPGEELSGAVGWAVENTPKSAEVRLFWYTAGKGTRDIGVVATQTFDTPKQNDERSFHFTFPQAPYTFSGALISLIWAVELLVEPGGLSERIEITVSPTGEEILLGHPEKRPPRSANAARA